jgi:TldD protein
VADYAGTSFLTPDKTGKFRFGSKIVNFVADRTQARGLATVGYDDDGVPAQRWYLVREGIFVDWQTTRELAPLIGRKTSLGAPTPTVGAACRSRACPTSRWSHRTNRSRSTI